MKTIIKKGASLTDPRMLTCENHQKISKQSEMEYKNSKETHYNASILSIGVG